MKKLSVVFAAACFAQVAIAAGPAGAMTTGNSVESSKDPGAAASAQDDIRPAGASTVSAPVRLTDAEMDEVVAGHAYLYLPSGEMKQLYRAGGIKVERAISTRGVCLIFNGGGSC